MRVEQGDCQAARDCSGSMFLWMPFNKPQHVPWKASTNQTFIHSASPFSSELEAFFAFGGFENGQDGTLAPGT